MSRTSRLNADLRHSSLSLRIQNEFTAKLIACGWRDDMKDLAKDAVRDSGGVTQVTVDQIVAATVPHGRATVPPELEEEMKEQLRRAIRQEQQR